MNERLRAAYSWGLAFGLALCSISRSKTARSFTLYCIDGEFPKIRDPDRDSEAKARRDKDPHMRSSVPFFV